MTGRRAPKGKRGVGPSGQPPVAAPARSVPDYPCTECGGDAFFGYTADKPTDWNGAVQVGERLCSRCAAKRGVSFFR